MKPDEAHWAKFGVSLAPRPEIDGSQWERTLALPLTWLRNFVYALKSIAIEFACHAIVNNLTSGHLLPACGPARSRWRGRLSIVPAASNARTRVQGRAQAPQQTP